MWAFSEDINHENLMENGVFFFFTATTDGGLLVGSPPFISVESTIFLTTYQHTLTGRMPKKSWIRCKGLLEGEDKRKLLFCADVLWHLKMANYVPKGLQHTKEYCGKTWTYLPL